MQIHKSKHLASRLTVVTWHSQKGNPGILAPNTWAHLPLTTVKKGENSFLLSGDDLVPTLLPSYQPALQAQGQRAEDTETTVPSALQVYTRLIRERGCQFAGWPACRFLCNSRAHLPSQACLWTKQVLLWAVDSFLVMALVCEQWELLQVLLFREEPPFIFLLQQFHTASHRPNGLVLSLSAKLLRCFDEKCSTEGRMLTCIFLQVKWTSLHPSHNVSVPFSVREPAQWRIFALLSCTPLHLCSQPMPTQSKTPSCTKLPQEQAATHHYSNPTGVWNGTPSNQTLYTATPGFYFNALYWGRPYCWLFKSR